MLVLTRRLSVFFVLFILGSVMFVPASAAQTPQRVQGLVTDTNGRPLAAVRVALVRGPVLVATAETAADGRFLLTLPATGCPDCALEAGRTGLVTSRMALPSAGDVVLTLAVAPRQEALVVTATRSETAPAIGGSSTTAITSDDMRRRGTPLVADVLRSTPGATIAPSGGLGGVTSLFVRGGESDYAKVLLDGIPLNEPGGAFNFSNVTTSGLERIEVVRGAMSALFGSDAMAGVVQLFSTRGRRASSPQLNASFEGGGYGTRRAEASVTGGTTSWDYAVSGARLDTDNRVPNNAFGNTSIMASAGATLDEQGRLALRTVFRTERQRVGVPGQTAFGRPDRDAFFERGDVVAGASLDHRASELWRQRVAVSVTDSRQTSTNLIADAPYTPSYKGRRAPFEFFDFTLDTHNVYRRITANYQADLTVQNEGLRHHVTVAIDGDFERATFEDRLTPTTLDVDRRNVGVAVQHQLVGRRIATTASLRAERNASFGTAVVPRASIGVVAHEGQGVLGTLTLRASAGVGVKEPSMLESFSQNFFFLGNPDLQPERSKTVDIGVDQDLLGGRATVGATWFEGRYRNQISVTTLDFSTFRGQYFNVGRTTARGVELSGVARRVAGLDVAAGYTWLDSRVVESTSPFSQVFANGAWTFRRPRHSGFLNASYALDRLSIDVSGNFSGRQVDSDFSALEPAITNADLPAVWTAGARYRWNGHVELRLRVENLTDADYMNPVGYEAWRRTVHTGLRFNF
jgi:vitamin B12 transporter